MFSAILTAAILFTQAAPDAAPPAAATPSPTAEAAPAPGGKAVSGVTVTSKQKAEEERQQEVVCHREQVLGSLFPKEVCASRQARAERTRNDQKDLRDSLLFNPLKVH